MEVCCAVANLEGLWARTSGWALNELEVWLFGLYLDARARYPRIGHPLRPCPSNRHHSATQEEKSFFISRATYILINSCNSHQKSFGPKITPAHDFQILVRNELCTLEERGSNTSHCTIILPTIRFLLKLNYLHVCILLCKMTFILFLKTYSMDWVLRSLLVLQKTIQSLNRKTWRWWPLSETLVPGASSHTTKEPWNGKQPRDHKSERSLAHSTAIWMKSDDPPVGLVLQALWEVQDSSQSGTHAACSLHAKASWTPWKKHLGVGNSSDHSLLCSLSTPAT